MTRLTITGASASVALAALLVSAAVAAGDAHRAPPPPVRDARAATGSSFGPGLAAATTEYSHGDPTDDEQRFLELMNRARSDPSGEADRILDDYDDADVRSAVSFFLDQRPGVEYTRNENHDAFDALPVAPPLAFNARLSTAAFKHTQVMQIADLQRHQLPGELRLGERIDAESYDWSGLGESIFAFAKSMLHAHAGFAIDWGQAVDEDTGLPATGHRDALMSVDFVECGIGVIDDDDAGTDVGPQLITIDFAVPQDTSTRFVTGVVYDDRNGNAIYDQGEGLPGVRIETDASEFFAISSSSGGYAVPVPSNAGTTTVLAAGQADTPGEVVGSQQVQVTVSGENVKVDFGPLPEPPLPDVVALDGATQIAIGDGATVDTTIAVGPLSTEDATVGDVDVSVDIGHDDRSELSVTLISPSGTEVLLFDGAPGGLDLRGEFDTSLRPVEPLSAFVGEPYEGTWTLRVTDASGGMPGAVIERWTLAIRPGWVRSLHGASTPLAVKTLKVKDSAKPGKDKVVVKAELDAGGALLNEGLHGGMRLLDATTGAVLVAVDLPDPLGMPGITPPVVKTKLDFHRNGSSRTALTLKVSGIDLAGALPATVRVELTLGGTIVAEDLTVESGKSQGVAGRRFFVDALKSKDKGGTRSTVVKGRFAAEGGLGVVAGTVELTVGDARFTFDASELVPKGTKLVRKSGVGLRKLIVDAAKGTFSAKIESDHELLVDGTTPVALRLGDGFYAATRVLPYAKGTKTLY